MESDATSLPAPAPNTGYAHEGYARSLAEFGTPRPLAESGGWALERPVPGTEHVDAMGSYPLLMCERWSQLGRDLAARAGGWVSFTCVVDPFGPSQETLREQGFDLARPFKQHWLVDLDVPYDEAVSDHHRRYARWGERRGVTTERVSPPLDRLDAWERLYDCLIERHDITGIQAFSRRSFAQQFEVPGFVMFLAEREGRTVAAHLWYEMGDVAYSHLTAANSEGYDYRASHALHREAIRYFRSRARWLNLGGGLSVDDDDGLSQFKKGWATDARPSLLGGRVLQPSVYEGLAAARGEENAAYFPAYRAGEQE